MLKLLLLILLGFRRHVYNWDEDAVAFLQAFRDVQERRMKKEGAENAQDQDMLPLNDLDGSDE